MHVFQLFLFFILMCPRILPGISLGYSAVALPQLNITINESSWFGSFSLIGSPFGFISSGLILNQLGRKIILLWSILPSIVGWFLLNSPFNPVRTYFGRFLTGLTTGASAFAVPIYLEETFMWNTSNFRSRFTTWSATALAAGVCLVYSTGIYFDYDELAFINFCFSSLIFVLIILFVPESPVWLCTRGRFGDADIVRKYLGIHMLSDEGSLHLINTVSVTNSMLNRKSILKVISLREVYKPLIITTVLLSFAMLSGGLILTTYMFYVMKTDTFTFKDTCQFALISGVLQLCITSSISFILPWLGNRKLTLISGTGLTIGMSLMALTSILNFEYYQEMIDKIYTVSIWFSISMFSLGFLTLPSALLSEIFPPEVQGLACIPVIISFSINCIIIKTHLQLYSYYGGGIYIFYAVMDAIGTYFVWVLMPETVGRSLKYIQRMNF